MARRKSIEFALSGDACVLWALMLLILPLRWILCAIIAAAFHECCHYLALRLCGVSVHGLWVGTGGASMETEPMGKAQELVCALAGPAGSLMLVFLIRWMPELAVCAGVQGLYNLLPIFPLDGGRAVRSFLGIFGYERVADGIQRIAIWFILILGFAACFCLHLGCGVLIVTFLLVRRGLSRKIPCKDGRKRVQ